MISLVPGKSLGSQSESPDLRKGARRVGRRAQADGGNRYARAREIQSGCRAGPASGDNQTSYSVPVVWGFLFVKREPPSLTL